MTTRILPPAAALLMFAATIATADDMPRGSIRLWGRWRATRQAVQACAEQARFRWAIPATISRRVFIGSKEMKSVAAKAAIEDICKQSGLTCTVIEKVLIFHVPKDERLRELKEKLRGADRTEKLRALCELGWLQDARVWPDLARMAAGSDAATALGAAQALRRLEGEEGPDWRIVGVSMADPDFTANTQPWQMPLGVAFPKTVSKDDVERMMRSRYFPVREAAARLTTCLGDDGERLCTSLARDPNPTVRRTAEQSLRAWAKPGGSGALGGGAPDGWYVTNLKAADFAIRRAREPQTVYEEAGRHLGFTGTPEAIKTLISYGDRGSRWSPYVMIPLAEFTGGPVALDWLKRCAAGGEGWGVWGLSALEDGETLARSLGFLLERGTPQWDAPPELTAARWAGVHALGSLRAGMGGRSHWCLLGLAHIGGPDAVETLTRNLTHVDPGVAVAAAKGLGDTLAYDAIEPLAAQLKHADRLHRHWAVLGLGRIGGPMTALALTQVLRDEAKRKDRLVRKAAAEILKEMGQLSLEATELIEAFEKEDAAFLPEYRPRNSLFDEGFAVNREVSVPSLRPRSYSSFAGTSVVMDWANRLLIRYGGDERVNNECFGLDVGTGTWFPIRATSLFIGWNGERRSGPGCARGMAYDGINKLVWIGAGVRAKYYPGSHNYGRAIGLSVYDVALDRFTTLPKVPRMPQRVKGDPARVFCFDPDTACVLTSSAARGGIPQINVLTRTVSVRRAPRGLPTFEYRYAAGLEYDPVAKVTMVFHPDLRFRTVLYDAQETDPRKGWKWSEARVPGLPQTKVSGGMVYDSLNKAMILLGGVDRDVKSIKMASCVFDRDADDWTDLEAQDIGRLKGNGGACVFDPEHNITIGLGGAYRYKTVPPGTKAYYGDGILAPPPPPPPATPPRRPGRPRRRGR